MTFQAPTASSTQAEFLSFQNIIEEIRQTLAGQLGSPYNTNPDSISFGTLASGSVIVSGNISVSNSSQGSNLMNSINNKIGSSSTFAGPFALTSSSYTASGFASTATSSAINMPLILGISIPVGVLFVVVAVIVIVKVRHRNNSIGSVEEQVMKEPKVESVIVQ